MKMSHTFAQVCAPEHATIQRLSSGEYGCVNSNEVDSTTIECQSIAAGGQLNTKKGREPTADEVEVLAYFECCLSGRRRSEVN